MKEKKVTTPEHFQIKRVLEKGDLWKRNRPTILTCGLIRCGKKKKIGAYETPDLHGGHKKDRKGSGPKTAKWEGEKEPQGFSWVKDESFMKDK